MFREHATIVIVEVNAQALPELLVASGTLPFRDDTTALRPCLPEEFGVAAQHARDNAQRQKSGARQPSSPDPFATDTFYSLLNVSFTANRQDIKRAYRQSMMRSHPDRALPEHRAQAEDIARLLNLAYTTLSDPNKRAAYDRTIRTDVVQSEIMNRYVGGPGGPGLGGTRPTPAHVPRRSMSAREIREKRQSDRSAIISLFSAFTVVVLAGFGLLLVFTIVSLVFSALF